MTRSFSEKTLIPISFVLTIAAGVYAFARVSAATEENTKDLSSLQNDVVDQMREQSEMLFDLKIQTATIETKLNSLYDRLGQRK